MDVKTGYLGGRRLLDPAPQDLLCTVSAQLFAEHQVPTGSHPSYWHEEPASPTTCITLLTGGLLVRIQPEDTGQPSPASPRGISAGINPGQKNGAFKKFEERRVLCAFASMRECPVAVLWVRRSETNRPSKCLEDTRGELSRKGLTHRRMSNDSPKIEWSCQSVDEQVGVGIPRQFSGRDGLVDQVYIHGSSWPIETFEEESPKHGICLNITDQADGDGCVPRMKPRRAADHTLMQPFER
jgi:hypothetical protein